MEGSLSYFFTRTSSNTRLVEANPAGDAAGDFQCLRFVHFERCLQFLRNAITIPTAEEWRRDQPALGFLQFF